MNRMEPYLVGERVYVTSASLSGPESSGPFEIMSVHDVEDREPMCRLLSLRDRAQRMVPQSELRRLA